MLKTMAAVGAVAGVLLLAPGARSPAHAVPDLKVSNTEAGNVIQVRRHVGSRRHAGRMARSHARVHVGRRHFAGRHFRGHRHFRGYYYGGSVYLGHSCRWLRHRAVVTGSAYWWRRYYRCRRGW